MGGGKFPLETTSLVGRERELAELEEPFGRARLLTLVGAGGSGKTRLVVRTASSSRSFGDGVWWVDLA